MVTSDIVSDAATRPLMGIESKRVSIMADVPQYNRKHEQQQPRVNRSLQGGSMWNTPMQNSGPRP